MPRGIKEAAILPDRGFCISFILMEFSSLMFLGKRVSPEQNSMEFIVVTELLPGCEEILTYLSLYTPMQFSPVKRCVCAILFSCLLPLSVTLAAVDVSFEPNLPARSMCVVKIVVLRPTQSAVGMKEVEMRVEKISKMTPKELEHYLRKHVAPIAIGPGGVPYLLDHQHLARALLQAHASETLYAEVKENWSKLSESEF
jgi:hypothetical protein